MSPRPKKDSAEKETKAAKGAKAAKAAKPGKAAKATKASARDDEDEEDEEGDIELEPETSEDSEKEAVNTDELEEAEEAEEEAAARSSGGGDAAALAAAAGGSEMSASFKNFRHHPDMENFYRFIFENDLRHEALAILDQIMIDKQAKKQGAPASKSGKGSH